MLVVDANKIIGALISGGKAEEIIFSERELIGPEKLFLEVENNKDKVAKSTELPVETVDILIELIRPEFKLFPRKDFPRKEFAGKLSEAKELSPHLKDVEYFALALEKDCPILSNEHDFKKQSRIKIFTPQGLLKS